jgi:hypothetical protein
MKETVARVEAEFVSETVVAQLTGRSRRTLQKDRLFRRGFPFYKIGTQVVYDVAEVRQVIRAARVEPEPSR